MLSGLTLVCATPTEIHVGFAVLLFQQGVVSDSNLAYVGFYYRCVACYLENLMFFTYRAFV